MSSNHRNPHILLVDDNPVDLQIFSHAFSVCPIPHKLDVAKDRESAMKFLSLQLELAPAALPRLILMDLNLPRVGGLELLREIKASDPIRRIPVIVMSSSRFERDVNSAYDAGASLYVQKPSELQGVEELAHTIASVWFRLGLAPIFDGLGTQPLRVDP